MNNSSSSHSANRHPHPAHPPAPTTPAGAQTKAKRFGHYISTACIDPRPNVIIPRGAIITLINNISGTSLSLTDPEFALRLGETYCEGSVSNGLREKSSLRDWNQDISGVGGLVIGLFVVVLPCVLGSTVLRSGAARNTPASAPRGAEGL